MNNAVSGRFATVGRTALIGMISLLAAACGLQRGPQGEPQGGSGPRHQESPGLACSQADVRLRIDLRSAGVAAGTEYLPLDFTNVSRLRCALTGLPTVTATTGAGGRRVGSAAVADGSNGDPLVLPAGGSAHLWLRLAETANLPPASCRPTRAAGFRVTLPGQDRAVFVRHPMITCARRVPGTDVLMIEPLRSGLARPGTAR